MVAQTVSEAIPEMSQNVTIAPGDAIDLPNAYILRFNSITINIESTGTTLLKVFGGPKSAFSPSPVIVQKTLQPQEIYSRTIGVISNTSFVRLENTGTVDTEVELTTIGSFVREPNSLVRQHVEVDATNNISLTKQGTTYDIDLSRSLLQNQEAPDITGNGILVASFPTTVWGATMSNTKYLHK